MMMPFQSLRAKTIGDISSEVEIAERQKRKMQELEAMERRKEKQADKKKYYNRTGKAKKSEPMGVPPGFADFHSVERRKIMIPAPFDFEISVYDATACQFRVYVNGLIDRMAVENNARETCCLRAAARYRFFGEGVPIGLRDTHMWNVLDGVSPVDLNVSDKDELFSAKWYILDLVWRILRVDPESLFVNNLTEVRQYVQSKEEREVKAS